jgi:lysozyme
MKALYVVIANICLYLFSSSAFSQPAPEEIFSRQELFSIARAVDQSNITQYALPPKFIFPGSARSESVFGVDISHNNESACQCEISWADLVKNNVGFVYIKATQGATYSDKTFIRSVPELQALQSAGKISLGAYHFLSSTSDASEQARHFLQVIGAVSGYNMPPSLDLEWDPGQYTADCPANALIHIRRTDGTLLTRCDLWFHVSAQDILTRANQWIDDVKTATGRDPIVYTNAAWWSERIGAASKINNLHTKLIWISDYSAGGLATEKPRVPAGHLWDLWQFSDTAKIKAGPLNLVVDASIF